MTFACVGFAAEPGHYPYHVPEQIKRIHDLGHEVASHSWKHEWFPFLELEQIKCSLLRSKQALEKCIEVPGGVTGFVPPFSRPMSWYRKGAISIGDRVFGPWFPGSNIGSLLRIVGQVGYTWCRFSYRSLLSRMPPKFQKNWGRPKEWEMDQGIVIVPHHHAGFDEPAFRLLDLAYEHELSVIISGHPSGLSLMNEENLSNFLKFIQRLSEYQAKGRVKALTISAGAKAFREGNRGK
jgi:peptidoglycan/xylan/chitin deacetylase (PgdA/CDA1 family)